MLTPQHVIEEVKRLRQEASDPIRFYWVDISAEEGRSDRDDFATGLRDQVSPYPLLPVVLRTPGFMDPNSVMNDLADVLEGSKQELLSGVLADTIRLRGHLDVVLIARRELALAITSSPLVLPDWFPVLAESEVTARIDDLTWTASVPLSASAAHIEDVRRLLYELDLALVQRLQVVGERDRRLAMGLLEKLRAKGESIVSVGDFATATQRALKRVRNPRDYRPTSRGSATRTMVSRLWYASIVTHSDGLPKVAKSLAKALQLKAANIGRHDESITAVLGRPTNSIGDPGVRWSFDVILTVGAACQLITAAAHADEYPRYPVRLVGSLSRELRRSLDGFIGVLEGRRA